MALPLLLALALVVAWTFLRFRQDKARAVAGQRRISEAKLLGLCVIGGSPAAYLARHLLRHKTRKQPFSNRLRSIAAAQAGAIGCAIVFGLSPACGICR